MGKYMINQCEHHSHDVSTNMRGPDQHTEYMVIVTYNVYNTA